MDLVLRVARLPLPGETLAGHGFETQPGGKGGNQAVAAARLGARVALVGAVGQDDFGQALLQALQADGVDTQAVARRAGVATGVAAVTVSDAGLNSIVLAEGANGTVTPADVQAAEAAIAAAQVLLLQCEVPLPAIEAAVALARRHGTQVLFNPAPVPAAPLPEVLLQQVDLLVPNEHEAALLSGLPVSDPDSARAAALVLHARGVQRLLITLGGQGVLLSGPEGAVHLPAPRVTPVDTTAAGDTFIGGVAACLAAGQPLAQAVAFGQQAAALSVTRRGAQASIPTRQEVLAASLLAAV
ncbi:ribokinase [Ideonella sp. TBM-1]|uniref:Deoxyribokinase n=2 Tax=Ideonella livida TaxID=2707176 RepID=A0A7C9PK59_9BURK|nr:ribokinase [Ideonella livida]